jgi:hypothetical protein
MDVLDLLTVVDRDCVSNWTRSNEEEKKTRKQKREGKKKAQTPAR